MWVKCGSGNLGSELRKEIAVKRKIMSVTGPALFGLGALGIASAWIYLFFFVIAPLFAGAPTP